MQSIHYRPELGQIPGIIQHTVERNAIRSIVGEKRKKQDKDGLSQQNIDMKKKKKIKREEGERSTGGGGDD